MTMPDVIEILVPGIQGPPGTSGAGGSAYTHIQASASAVWTVNHNLGVNPVISVFTPGGAEMVAEILHTSLNQANLSFVTPQTGTARCI